MKAFFVSDIHLKDESKNKGPIFLKFLRELPSDCTHLFLLGDIFDLWIGDHSYFENKFNQTIHSIADLKKRGIEVHYFEGNHDIHLSRFWESKLGLNVHKDEAFFKLGSKVVRAEHGDKMNPEDKGYIFLRWLLRTKPMESLAYNLPGEIVSWIGDNSSKLSRVYTDRLNLKYKEKVIDLTRHYAHLVHSSRPFDFFICGHTHVDDDFTFNLDQKPIRSINLGSWLDRPKTLLFTDSDQKILFL